MDKSLVGESGTEKVALEARKARFTWPIRLYSIKKRIVVNSAIFATWHGTEMIIAAYCDVFVLRKTAEKRRPLYWTLVAALTDRHEHQNANLYKGYSHQSIHPLASSLEWSLVLDKSAYFFR